MEQVSVSEQDQAAGEGGWAGQAGKAAKIAHGVAADDGAPGGVALRPWGKEVEPEPALQVQRQGAPVVSVCVDHEFLLFQGVDIYFEHGSETLQ
ncbi:hypothetical protein ABT364_01055 [Massilia sp. SR12]